MSKSKRLEAGCWLLLVGRQRQPGNQVDCAGPCCNGSYRVANMSEMHDNVML